MVCVVGPEFADGAGAAMGLAELPGTDVLNASLAEAMNRALSAGVSTRPVESTIGRCAMRTIGSLALPGTPPGMSPLGLWPKAEDRHTTADSKTMSLLMEMPFFGAAKRKKRHRGSAADFREYILGNATPARKNATKNARLLARQQQHHHEQCHRNRGQPSVTTSACFAVPRLHRRRNQLSAFEIPARAR